MNHLVQASSRRLVAVQSKRPAAMTALRCSGPKNKNMSSTTNNPLEGDAGALATRAHHAMTVSLAVLTPVFFMVPDSWTDGTFNKTFGMFLTANITAHSWIGLNYVATDYVPKVSKALLGPARYVNAGIAVLTFLGLGKISLSSPGGIKRLVKGIWNPKPTKKGDLEF